MPAKQQWRWSPERLSEQLVVRVPERLRLAIVERAIASDVSETEMVRRLLTDAVADESEA